MEPDQNKIIRYPELIKILGGVHRGTISCWEKLGKFPRRINLGARAVGWLKKDVDAWIEDKRIESN